MSKPTLDKIEIESLKNRMDALVGSSFQLPVSSLERAEISKQVEPLARRYKELTGHYYTFRHAHDYQGHVQIHRQQEAMD